MLHVAIFLSRHLTYPCGDDSIVWQGLTYICWGIDICIDRWFLLRLKIEWQWKFDRVAVEVAPRGDNGSCRRRRGFGHFRNTVDRPAGWILNEKEIRMERMNGRLTSSWRLLRFLRDEESNLYFFVHGRPGIFATERGKWWLIDRTRTVASRSSSHTKEHDVTDIHIHITLLYAYVILFLLSCNIHL